MSEFQARATEAINALSASLRELADLSEDIPAASAARDYARRLDSADSKLAEQIVLALRANLGRKSNLTDGLNQSQEYWVAYGRVESAAKSAGNWLVALRRPQLAHIASRRDEA